MQVKALLPLRSVRIPPFGSGTTMVAFSATFFGAAFMALATSSSSVGGGLAPSAVAAWCIEAAPAAGGSAAHAELLKIKSTVPAETNRIDLFIEIPYWNRF